MNDETTSLYAGLQEERQYVNATRYDMAGRITGTIAPDPDANGPLRFAATRITYNEQGLQSIVEEGELSIWQNDSIAPKNWTGFTVFRSSIYYYDERARVVGLAINNRNEVTINFTQTNYDSEDRVVCEARRQNPAVFNNVDVDACTPTLHAQFGWDRVTKYTYTQSHAVENVYKAWGTPLQQRYKHYTYYGNSHRIKTVTDANSNQTTYEYDINNNIERITYPDLSFQQYQYDASRNVVREQKRSGAVFEFEYDNMHQMKQKREPTLLKSVSYGYTTQGLLSFITKGQGYNDNKVRSSYLYDSRGNLDTYTIAEGFHANRRVRTLQYEYDRNGNRTALTFPDGQRFSYRFDKANRLKSLHHPSGSELVGMRYAAEGYRNKIERSNSADTNIVKDDIGRTTSFSHDFSQNIYDLTHTFMFNNLSQVTTKTISNLGYLNINL